MSVLILASPGDNDVDLVVPKLAALGVEARVLATEGYPTRVRISSHRRGTSLGGAIETEAWTLELSSIRSLWIWRVRAGFEIPAAMGARLHSRAVEESRRALHGLLASLPCYQMSPLPVMERAVHKELQLQVAARVGLEIPATLVTNSPQAARDFYAEHGGFVVAKTLSSVMFTSALRPEHLDHLDELALAPVVLQSRIAKQAELRIIFVAGELFTMSLASHLEGGGDVDWRRTFDQTSSDWKPFELPADVRARLLELMRELGLAYGAIDMIVTPDGRHVFLEVNPAGGFGWLDRPMDGAISSALAAVLARAGR